MLSPLLLSTAEPKSYISIKGIAKKNILRYSVASFKTSSGTFIMPRSIGASISPTPSMINPLMTAKSTTVCTASFALSFLPWPISLATTTFAPTESPRKRLTIRFTNEELLPTAAMALSLSNLPTTARSAELKSCCKILDNARGSAKITILPTSGPFNISIFLFFIPDLLSSFN